MRLTLIAIKRLNSQLLNRFFSQLSLISNYHLNLNSIAKKHCSVNTQTFCLYLVTGQNSIPYWLILASRFQKERMYPGLYGGGDENTIIFKGQLDQVRLGMVSQIPARPPSFQIQVGNILHLYRHQEVSQQQAYSRGKLI